METKYVVLEIQTNEDGTVGNIATAFGERYNAESAYHTVLAAAALSTLPVHMAYLLTNDGDVLGAKVYRHNVEGE